MHIYFSSYLEEVNFNYKKLIAEFSWFLGSIIKIGCRSLDVNYALLLTLHLSTKIDSVSLNLSIIPSARYTLLIYDRGWSFILIWIGINPTFILLVNILNYLFSCIASILNRVSSFANYGNKF